MLCACAAYPDKAHSTYGLGFPGTLSQVRDTVGFLYDQGTEKAGESGENEAQQEDKEDEGDLTKAQEEKVSVRLCTDVSLAAALFLSTCELLSGAGSLSGCRGEDGGAAPGVSPGRKQAVFTKRVNCCGGGGYWAKRKSEEGPESRSGGGGWGAVRRVVRLRWVPYKTRGLFPWS